MKTGAWAMRLALAAGLAGAGLAQTAQMGGGGSEPKVVLVLDPFHLPSEAELQRRRDIDEYNSRAIYMGEGDRRLPTAEPLHDRMRFGQPETGEGMAISTNEGGREIIGTMPSKGGMVEGR